VAVIKSFKAMRFTGKAGDLKSLVCPPYDIINEAEREEYLKTNEYNIIRLELPRDGDDPYAEAGMTLKKWLREEILAIDETPALYIYEEEFLAAGIRRKVKGFTCRVRLEEFSAGVVLPHEETLSKAKTDRFNLMCAAKSNFSAVQSLYFDEQNTVFPIIDALSQRAPDNEITDGAGVVHRLWVVTEQDKISEIVKLMVDKKIYIADGHHRYETALHYRKHLAGQGKSIDENHPANHVMMHLVNMENDGLVVFPTHRVVRRLPGFNMENVLKGCKRYFEVSDCADAEQALSGCEKENKKAFVMYTGGESKLLVLKDVEVMKELLPGKSQVYRNLDVSVLHTLVLERLLGIDKENMANQKNLVYTRSVPEAYAAVDNGEANCAFLMNPTKVSEIAEVSGANEKMPQKSTYFYPKLITGLAMNPLFDK